MLTIPVKTVYYEILLTGITGHLGSELGNIFNKRD
jgi:hypothetical protein